MKSVKCSGEKKNTLIFSKKNIQAAGMSLSQAESLDTKIYAYPSYHAAGRILHR